MTIFSTVRALQITSRDSKLSWLTLTASVLVLQCSFGFLQSFGILYNAFLEEYRESKKMTAWVGSIPLSMMCALAPVASWILNRSSLRFCSAVIAIPIGLSLLLASYARNISETIAAFSIPFGFTSCMLLMISTKSAQVYFDKRMVTAMGIMTGGCAISQVGFANVIIMLLNKYSLEQTLRVLAGLMASICIVASQFYLPTSYEHNQQNSVSANKRGICFYFQLLRKKQYAIFVFATFICGFAYGVSSVHQVQLALEYGVKENIARQFPVFSAISNALGRVSCGFIADSHTFQFASYYTSMLLLNGTVAIVGSFSYSPAHLIVYIWFYAFTDGVIQVCCTLMVRETLGLDAYSEGMAFMLTIDSISVMLGPPLLGFIVDETRDYRAYFFVAGLPTLLAGFIILPLRFMTKVEDKKNCINEELFNEKEVDCDPIKRDYGKDEHVSMLYQTTV